jgi:hypothetical protein
MKNLTLILSVFALLVAGAIAALDWPSPANAVQTAPQIDHSVNLQVGGSVRLDYATASTPPLIDAGNQLVSGGFYVRSASTATCASVCSPGICAFGQVTSTTLLAACSASISGSCVCLTTTGDDDNDDNDDNDNDDNDNDDNDNDDNNDNDGSPA